jgi:RNA polymerase sigma-70 factor (ECF subfamily)
MQTRTPLNAAAPLVAGALLGWLADSIRLATPVQAADKPAASAELDRTVRPVFVLANQHRRWELNDLARRLDHQADAVELCEGLVPAPVSSDPGAQPGRAPHAPGDRRAAGRRVGGVRSGAGPRG